MQYYRNFQLKKYNSFHVKSIAKEIWFPNSIQELQLLLKLLKWKKFFILANGTNVILKSVISRVICLKSMPKYVTFLPKRINISANYLTTSFILETLKHNITGIEGLYGIPGTIGGAVTMNAGSGKYTISDYLVSVTIMDLEGNLYVGDKKSLQLNRRYSILQNTNEIIISIVFSVKYGKSNNMELKKAQEHRKTFPKLPSAGGIFINWHELKPYRDKLIGLRIADAEVSSNVNIIVNKGNATYQDIINLIHKIKKIVKEPLELEVKILG